MKKQSKEKFFQLPKNYLEIVEFTKDQKNLINTKFKDIEKYLKKINKKDSAFEFFSDFNFDHCNTGCNIIIVLIYSESSLGINEPDIFSTQVMAIYDKNEIIEQFENLKNQIKDIVDYVGLEI